MPFQCDVDSKLPLASFGEYVCFARLPEDGFDTGKFTQGGWE